ncbi:MAG TPA: hypothetical protein ACFYD2_10910, partial [Candidatus Avalokitesvara rifleensis]|uniref:hypothetical protein n=1 Tax=Candidatus Avalokitesvara rifleensis TaxID=3367620 RepID=UPI0040295EF6
MRFLADENVPSRIVSHLIETETSGKACITDVILREQSDRRIFNVALELAPTFNVAASCHA